MSPSVLSVEEMLMDSRRDDLWLVLSVEEPMSLEPEDPGEERPALVPSLFPLIPPTLYFSTAHEKGQDCSTWFSSSARGRLLLYLFLFSSSFSSLYILLLLL